MRCVNIKEKEIVACSFCSKLNTEDSGFVYNTKFGKNICNKHYNHLRKYGKILERTMFDKNEIIFYDDYAEIVCYSNDGVGNNQVEVCRAVIDKSDVDKCSNFKWHLSSNGYVYTGGSNSNYRSTLHKHVTNYKYVDHINGDKLNNKKENLRECTHFENSLNQKINKKNSSGVSGVHYEASRKKWISSIRYKGRKIMKRFSEKEDAIIFRLYIENKLFKEFSPQNVLFKQYKLDDNENYKDIEEMVLKVIAETKEWHHQDIQQTNRGE